MTPVKVPFENEVVDADQVNFESSGGAPELLELEDGTKIEFGHQVKTIFKLRDKKKEDGSPVYICAGQVNIKVTRPVVEGEEGKA